MSQSGSWPESPGHPTQWLGIEDKNSTKALNGFLKKYSMIF